MADGESFVAVLVEREGGNEWERFDFSVEAWEGGSRPFTGAVVATWRGVLRARGNDRRRRAVTLDDAELVELFERLGDGSKEVLRYLVAMILARRRVLRLEGERLVGGRPVVRFRWVGRPTDPVLELADPGLDESSLQEASEALMRALDGDDEVDDGGGGEVRP